MKAQSTPNNAPSSAQTVIIPHNAPFIAALTLGTRIRVPKHLNYELAAQRPCSLVLDSQVNLRQYLYQIPHFAILSHGQE